MQHPSYRRLALVLVGLLLALLVVACGDTTPTQVISNSGSTQSPAQVLPTSLPDQPPAPPDFNSGGAPNGTYQPPANSGPFPALQPTSAVEKPIPPTFGLPPTATPTPQTPPTPEPSPTILPPTPPVEVEQEAQAVPRPSLEQLPRVNGIVKVPVLNSSSRIAQPPPEIKANYGIGNAPRVGLQIGHFNINELPEEQASLRNQTGGSGGGVREVDVNQDIVRRVAALLLAKGVTVDILPASVPAGYTADAFIAIHADAATSGNPSGYKLARSRFSAIPVTDDDLVNTLYATYGKATGLKQDGSITRDMLGYYAFNNRSRLYAVSKVTPAAILEMGFLTNSYDRTLLTTQQTIVAQGVADGIMQFLQNRPPLERREKAQTETLAVEVKQDNTPIYDEAGNILAYVSQGQRFEYSEDKGINYGVYIPVLRKAGLLSKADVKLTFVPR